MATQWFLETHGDPLGVLRSFTQRIWERMGLNAMLVLLDDNQEFIAHPSIIEDKVALRQANPFKPLMTINSAQLVPEFANSYRDHRIGVLLRSCEMRALIEMTKHDSLNLEHLFTICVDCLGTLPLDEFKWQAQRRNSSQKLTEEALKFARQGGILAYRYRSACQICSSPEAQGADINIGVIGLPAHRYILIEIHDETLAEKFYPGILTAKEVDIERITQRKRVLAKLHQRNEQTFQRMICGIVDFLPTDIHRLTDQLDDCSPCQECLNHCPICTIDYPTRNANEKYPTEQIARWVISCIGCGMCEQACPKHLPLNAVFTYMQRQLTEAFNYIPGFSRTQPLPI